MSDFSITEDEFEHNEEENKKSQQPENADIVRAPRNIRDKVQKLKQRGKTTPQLEMTPLTISNRNAPVHMPIFRNTWRKVNKYDESNGDICLNILYH